jgi:tripeptidyl-peptidase-1
LLHEALRNISDPGSVQYGQHLGKDDVKQLVKPSETGVKAVMDWIKRSSIQGNDVNIDGEWINFVATKQQADGLMGTQFLNYRNAIDNDISVVRTTEVSLPNDIYTYVKLIHPTTHFARATPQEPNIHSFQVDNSNDVDPSCNKLITPKCLKDLYHIKGVTPDPAKAGFIGVAGFLGETPAHSDLTQFAKENADWALDANYTSSLLNG